MSETSEEIKLIHEIEKIATYDSTTDDVSATYLLEIFDLIQEFYRKH